MLPKIYRLTKKSDFQRVYRKGLRFRTNNLMINYLRNRNEASRLGFVVSKKLSNKANRRNYLKRVMRAAFADLPKALSLSYDIIITLNINPTESGVYQVLMRDKAEVVKRFKARV
jgi:ribonuclease P protein component